MAVAVSQVNPSRHPPLLSSATIINGPVLLSWAAEASPSILADSQGTARGSAFSSHLFSGFPAPDEDLHLPTAQPPLELLALLGGESLLFALVNLGLLYRVPQGVARDPEHFGDLRDRPARGVDKSDRRCLELRRILRFCPLRPKLLSEDLLSSMFGCA